MKAKRKETWSVAESCTGGAIANAITDVAGASKYFKCGIVAYSNEAKVRLLGVSKNTLKKFGAVSGEVAEEMAEGMRKHFKTTRALAVTGIAGPTGGSKEKPVGTVYIALATIAKTEVKHFCFAGGRIPFKKKVTAIALRWLRKKRL